MARRKAAMGGLTSENWGGARENAGRKSDEEKGIEKEKSVSVPVYIPESMRDYLLAWSPGKEPNLSAGARELIERAMKMWPKGV